MATLHVMLDDKELADWPDAARIDAYVRHRRIPPMDDDTFARFPTWMWRNEEVADLVNWMRDHNRDRSAEDRVEFRGLDVYSLHSSIREVLAYRIAEKRWVRLADLPTPRHGVGVAALGGRVYVIGGGPEPGLTVSSANESIAIAR